MSNKANNEKALTKKGPLRGLSFKDMTFKDLKKACVLKGMDFTEVVGGDFWSLQSWLHRHMSNKDNPELLRLYDDWLDNELIMGGNEDLVHSSLRLGYVGDRDDDEDKPKKIKPEPKLKVKKEKTAEGIFSGTKKALTFKCEKEGKTLEETISTVMENFPDAAEKSIKIWYKKSKRTK